MPLTPRTAVDPAAYRRFRRLHNRLSWILIGALVALALAFDLLSVYAREFMGAPVAPDSVISTGLVMALVLILLILVAAFYYVRRVNSAYLEMHESRRDG